MDKTPMDNMVYSPSINLVDAVIDEVALEGLDGITLEALWQRLAQRLKVTDSFPRSMKEQIWTICVSIKELTFYQLESPREPLIIYDRYVYVDPDLGTIHEPDDIPDDIYEHYPIDEVATGIRGSCKSYHTRKRVETVELTSLEYAETRYGQTLVIVASQSVRQHALIGDAICPIIELNVLQYCFLERVGRSRYHGEITQGKRSLSQLKEDPKTLFYYRKYLLKHKLITKQTHYQRNSGHGTSGSLLHLPRFFVERKPKMIFLAERIIEILKSRESGLVDINEIKTELQIENSIKRLFKTNLFQRVVRTDLSVPYRMLYPDAQSSEWQRKSCGMKEKKIRAVQLIDPNIDVNDLWNKDDAGMEDDEISHELNVASQKINEPFLKQANLILEEAQYDGLSQSELAIKMGVTKLSARTILKNLSRLELVATFMNDVGRQRLTKYVSKRFEKNSSISKQFYTETNKLKEFLKASDTTAQPIVTSTKIKRPQADVREVTKQHTPMEVEESPISQRNRKNTFQAVMKLRKKYKLTRCLMNYNVTFQNLTETHNMQARLEQLLPEEQNSSAQQIELVASIDEDDPKNNYRVIQHEVNVTTNSIGEIRSLIADINNPDPKTGVTYRILRRANLIIQSVREHQVIDDLSKLMKMISEEEERECYFAKIDKKSLLRIIHKLSIDKLVQLIKLTIIANGRQKPLTFICDPSITVNHAVIQSAIEQTKIKLYLDPSTRKRKAIACSGKETARGGKKSKKQANNDPSDEKFVKPKSNAKFVQMQLIHKLMFYMIYDHPGPSKLTRAQQIEKLRTDGYQLDDTMIKEMCEIYTDKVDWRMFIPPLPNHYGWPKGWALLCDILLRLPLSTYLQIYKFDFPGLNDYKDHRIKRHYLIKDLPTKIRNTLLMGRTYITSIHGIIAKLCHIGLVQFGPQKLKEKDQVFIFLNRRSELMDTSSSAAGYHLIEDKEYPTTKYEFDNSATVDNYWSDMWHICINTQLGKRVVVQGTAVTIDIVRTKPSMLKTLMPRRAKEAPELDLGIMPGDKKGAAGIDSAMFPHLRKNWNWSNFKGSKKNTSDTNKRILNHTERNSRLAKIQQKPIKFTEFTGLQTITGPMTMDVGDLKTKKREKSQQKKLKTIAEVNELLRKELVGNARNREEHTIIRHVKPRKPKQRVREKFDAVDYNALQYMDRRRVEWDPREDNILLVCKSVMMYLCPNPRSQLITFAAVRDVLHSYSRSSRNKTSRACQRRVLHLMKQPETSHSVALGVEEIRQNNYIKKRYSDVIDKIKKTNPDKQDEKCAAVFKDLVAFVAKTYYAILETDTNTFYCKSKTLGEFNLLHTINHLKKAPERQGFVEDIRGINDIHVATINSVIYSSLHCDNDGKQWGYQRFRIYQQYSEALLHKAMQQTRSDQMVSIKKNHAAAMKKISNCMPMNSSHHQLSTNYIYKFQTSKLPAEIYPEMQSFFRQIIQGYRDNALGEAKGVSVAPTTGGAVVGIQELLMLKNLDFNIEIPDQIITLESKPNEDDDDENYNIVEMRYQDILTRLEQGQTGTGNNKTDVDQQDNEVVEPMVIEESVETSEVLKKQENTSVNNEYSGRRAPAACWGWGHGTDSDTSEDEDDNEYIQLEIGKAVVAITKDDIDVCKLTEVNDSIHEAFFKTRGETIDKCPPWSSLQRLNELTSDDENTPPTDVHKSPVREIKMQMEIDTTTDAVINAVNSKASNFVNDIIAMTGVEHQFRPLLFQKIDESSSSVASDMPKPSSRIALLRMRKELNECIDDNHHAHKYFVVNSFGVYYSLPQLDAKLKENPHLILDDHVTDELLSFNNKTYDSVINELNVYALFPLDFPDYLNIRQYMSFKLPDVNVDDIDRIYEYVRNKREHGAILRELTMTFYKTLGNKLYDILHCITERRLFLRTGVTKMHYIHHNYVKPWTIQSIKLTRLHRESLTHIPQGSVYGLKIDRHEKVLNCDDGRDIEMLNVADTTDFSHINQVKSDGSSKNATTVNDGTDDITVVIRPWIQIDGLINRSTLEKMLGAVLTHCILHPGIVMADVKKRFVPALQPYHTRELVEILVKMECLQLKVLCKSATTLISRPSSTKLCYPVMSDGTSEYDHELIIEPVVGATLKFGAFFRHYNPQVSSTHSTDQF